MDVEVMIIKCSEKYLIVKPEVRDRSGHALMHLWSQTRNMDPRLLPFSSQLHDGEPFFHLTYGAGVTRDHCAELPGSVLFCRVRPIKQRHPELLQPALRLMLIQQPFANI
jgi:hypothetical protein